MKPNPVHRLPALLEAAAQRLKLAAREAAERTIESLGLAARAATHPFQRDAFMGAQFELNRKSAVFILNFNNAFDERVVRELGPRAASGQSPAAKRATAESTPTELDVLGLVDDRDVEVQISAERFGMQIAHAYEWELRELDAYVAALLAEAGGDRERNPLRPHIVGHALIRSIGAVSDRAEVREVLSSELSRALAALLRGTYQAIVADFRRAGVQPIGLTVRHRPGGARDIDSPSHMGGYEAAPHTNSGALGGGSDGRPGARRSGPPRPSDVSPTTGTGHAGGRSGKSLGQVDPELMSLMRRLTNPEPTNATDATDTVSGYYEPEGVGDRKGGGSLPNLIHEHREELRKASKGSLDHMVIDVIGFLFDQILADPKVPPQMARLIARLQLPVLRAALGDPSFFSSRRHPVRRFVNRIAYLGAGFEDFSEDSGKDFLAKVRALVNEVVEGDFDQIEIYQQKLDNLEAFVAEQASREVQTQSGAAALLSEKEDELRLRELYSQRLTGELKEVAGPAFVRDFVSRIWSQVLLRAEVLGGPEGPLVQKFRRVGRELMLSVQPKPTAAHRKAFLATLPKLMQDLTEGMNLIDWPEVQRRDFFAQLMPAHADALRNVSVRQLDLNLMARQIEGLLQRPLPSRDDLRSLPVPPVLSDEFVAPALNREEAQRVGLIEESAVNWAGPVDIDLSAEPESEESAAEPVAPGLPAFADEAEPTQGRELAHLVQVGFAYQMYLNNQWERVRLSHVSPGRSFFMFTVGARHKKTVSLTQRMLMRLCETGRLRAFETSTLVDRATARARRQLAALSASSA